MGRKKPTVTVFRAYGEHPINGTMSEWRSTENKADKALAALQDIGCREPMGVEEELIPTDAKGMADWLNSKILGE